MHFQKKKEEENCPKMAVSLMWALPLDWLSDVTKGLIGPLIKFNLREAVNFYGLTS